MPKIKLIVTGDMEQQALPQSLKRFFPTVREGSSVEWVVINKVSGTTTDQLISGEKPSGAMQKLARALLAEIKDKRNQQALVLAVDDTELGNINREEIIADHFRRAIEKNLEIEHKQNPAYAEKLREHIRSRASFHLLTPMPEAYFFGASDTLSIMGIEPNRPKLRHPTDVEQFESSDPNWLTTCYRENERKLKNEPWWKHECHPKHYLNHLLNFTYLETTQGKKALEELRWDNIPKCDQDARCIRALFQDLANWFAISNPIGNGDMHPAFSNFADNDQKTLRNM